MAGLTVTGRLICRTRAETDRVRSHLPAHLAATRGEPGCLSFRVTPTGDPLMWKVSERFRDRTAYEAHQSRAAASDWSEATAGMPRVYGITEG